MFIEAPETRSHSSSTDTADKFWYMRNSMARTSRLLAARPATGLFQQDQEVASARLTPQVKVAQVTGNMPRWRMQPQPRQQQGPTRRA